MAKKSNIKAVRVLDALGSGTTTTVLSGLQAIINRSDKTRPAVVSMSLGGGFSLTLNDAVQKVIDSGAIVVVAAGNDNIDACNSSPASVPQAITVGSSTITDARSSFSNVGACVDMFAPGSSILSAWLQGTTAKLSGTSMACPQVAGAAALYVGINKAASPSTV